MTERQDRYSGEDKHRCWWMEVSSGEEWIQDSCKSNR